MTPSILSPSDETFITPSLTSDFEFSVFIIFHIYAGDCKYVAETVFTNNPAGFWMIDQNSISVVVQGSIFFGCALVMG